MKVQIFAIHDSKAKSYLQPFFLHNKDMATRSFTSAVNDPDTTFHKHPLDYTLFNLGTYDDELGLIESLIPPEMITNAIQVLDKPIETLRNDATIQHKEPQHEI